MDPIKAVLHLLLGAESLLVFAVAGAVTLYVFAGALLEGITRTVKLLTALTRDIHHRSTALRIACRELCTVLTSDETVGRDLHARNPEDTG